MPRRKPTSTKQKKAEQQLKRAVKRGDIPPPEPKRPTHTRKPIRIGPTGRAVGATSNAIDSARRLQSTFIKLPQQYLEQTRSLASSIPLSRPIASDVAIFSDSNTRARQSPYSADSLICPKRPKWRFDMSKKEVEANEEGFFKKWLAATDELLEKWWNEAHIVDSSVNNNLNSPTLSNDLPRCASYYERNLEVWRQLWRVTEISQIILVLLDSRCPLLHYPSSLRAYLSGRKVILVLTKTDISGCERAQAWSSYLGATFPGVRVVQVESYMEKETGTDHQGRKRYEPRIPMEFRRNLVNAIRDLHSEMLQPPEKVKSNEAWIKTWKPSVKQLIDWDAVMNAQGDKVGIEIGGALAPMSKGENEQIGAGEAAGTDEQGGEPQFLTVGLIGQPNVGKSSLLNALFGTNRVRASKTPGKTKHFQTLFWTHDVRLVDCPGLVMPSYIPMEMQVLSGVLPISRISAIPACIYYACQYLPIEQIFNLSHPDLSLLPVEDKRTWREGVNPTSKKERVTVWTAMDVLVSYANLKGWVTAKAGRPDVNRAGNAILRLLAEGKVAWAFWPPATDPALAYSLSGSGNGIWIRRKDEIHVELSDDDEGSVEDGREDEATDEAPESSPEIAENTIESVGIGRFGALQLDDVDDDDEDSESVSDRDAK